MQLNAVVAPKSKGEPLPLMLIFQGPVPVADNDQWPHTSGFPAFLESNSCGSNYGAVIIKHYHFALNPWLHTINVSASIKKKALLIFDGCPSHLNIDTLKDMGRYGMVVLIHMTNTSHDTNVEDLVTFGTAKT